MKEYIVVLFPSTIEPVIYFTRVNTASNLCLLCKFSENNRTSYWEGVRGNTTTNTTISICLNLEKCKMVLPKKKIDKVRLCLYQYA